MAIKLGLNISTLRRKVKREQKIAERPCPLTEDEEKILVHTLLGFADNKTPYSIKLR